MCGTVRTRGRIGTTGEAALWATSFVICSTTDTAAVIRVTGSTRGGDTGIAAGTGGDTGGRWVGASDHLPGTQRGVQIRGGGMAMGSLICRHGERARRTRAPAG